MQKWLDNLNQYQQAMFWPWIIPVLGILALVLVCLLLSGCGEPASCWNSERNRYTSCSDMRGDEADRRAAYRNRKDQQ